jgi:SAM-dependent methyltransferase
MIESRPWDWRNVESPRWTIPAEDVYYLADRWAGKGGSMRLLDLGCGLGRHSLFFAERGFDVTGYDLSTGGLERLRLEAGNRGLRVDTVSGDMTQLPFDGGAFDFLLAYQSIYHTGSEGMRLAIAEMGRVLSPGGEAYATLIAKDGWSYPASDALIIDDRVRLKREEDGSLLPHCFTDAAEIPGLFGGFLILGVRRIEEIGSPPSSPHYHVLAKKDG